MDGVGGTPGGRHQRGVRVVYGDCSSIGQSTGLWLRGLRVRFPSVTLGRRVEESLRERHLNGECLTSIPDSRFLILGQ